MLFNFVFLLTGELDDLISYIRLNTAGLPMRKHSITGIISSEKNTIT